MRHRDLAALSAVETKHLNRALPRTLDRFPAALVSQLPGAEARNHPVAADVRRLKLLSASDASSASARKNQSLLTSAATGPGGPPRDFGGSKRQRPLFNPFLNCQFGTSKTGRRRHRKNLPYAFTKHGTIMAANVLNSPQATQRSVYVVRHSVNMRSVLSDTKSLARKLAPLEKDLKSRLDLQEAAMVEVLQRVMDILDPPPQPKRRQIGFHGDADPETN